MLLAVAFAVAACSADGASLSTTPADSTTASTTVAGGARWSDPSTWPDARVPVAGSDVVIPAGKRVVLDGTTAPIRTLTIMGELTAQGSDVRLTAAKIDVTGRFDVGSADAPFTGHLVVTLTDGAPAGDAFDKGIVVHQSAALELFGEHRTTWTRLGATADVGATRIQLEKAVDWRAGDRIVIASSVQDQSEAEVAVVRAVSGATLELDRALAHRHWGTLQQIAGVTLDERAEVALLTHNIVIEGDSASEIAGHGGHVMVMRGGSAHVDGIEMYRMGQHAVLARYPFHWHMAGSVPGQYFTSSSVWHTFNRCVTIHGTHDALVADDVCYDHEGHGYFLEDGIEHGNTLRGDLGLVARKGAVIPSDDAPSTFWITNPDNTFENDVAAGSSAFGFWIAPPLHPTGYSATDAVWPQSTPLRRFDSNVAHSSGMGIHAEEDARISGYYHVDYRPRAGATPDGAPAEAVYSRVLLYANELGMWARGDYQHLENSVIADNRTGVQIADANLTSNSEISGSTFIGTSANAPTVRPLLGFKVYDGPVYLHGVTFANYPANISGAIGTASRFDGRVSPAMRVEGIRLVDAQPYLVPEVAELMGERMMTLRDLDGSLTGVTGGTVVTANVPFEDSSCTARSAWNAKLCSVSYVHLGLYDLANACPATVRSDAGAAVDVDCPSDHYLSFVAPTRHDYTAAPPISGNVNLMADGLAPGEWATFSVPWTDSTISAFLVVDRKFVAVPVVASRTELDRQSTTSVWMDRAAGMVVARFVGAAGDDMQYLAVRTGSYVVR